MILHGLVHLLYFGQARRMLYLSTGMTWPDGSWALAGLLNEAAARNLGSILMLLCALAIVAGGFGLLAEAAWARPVLASGLAFSSLSFVVLWDGSPHDLRQQGGIGVLLNLLMLAALSWLRIG